MGLTVFWWFLVGFRFFGCFFLSFFFWFLVILLLVFGGLDPGFDSGMGTLGFANFGCFLRPLASAKGPFGLHTFSWFCFSGDFLLP